ncbi:MAG: glycosyltransferase family 4 protein [Clostridiales bacterium]|nr:glycosyltransferase family 4 protein [Clostridiales bacterium]
MNIGIFTDAYYPQINGVVISTQILKEELENLGHKVTVITVSDPNIENEKEGVLRLKSIPFAVLPNFRVGQVYSHKMMKTIKALNLDIIHTQTEFSLGIFARIISKRLNIPIVHTYHTMYEDYTHYFSPKRMEKTAKKITQKLTCYLCKTVDSVIVPTKKVEDKLIDYGFKKAINVVPTGVNLRPFEPSHYSLKEVQETREELNIDKSSKVILYVGRLAKEKSIDVLLKAMPDVINETPDAILLIVGDGPEMINLKALAENLGCQNHIVFAGKKPWASIGKYYQVASVFVSASTSETQGLTYIEAMAAKKPVIAKYDTNLEETISDGITGRFFFEDQELAPLLNNVLKDELLSRYLSKNGYDSVKNASSVIFGESVEEVYYNTVNAKHHQMYSKESVM